MTKCGYCGKTVVKYPIKGQPEKTLEENYKEKTIIWKNLFKMDFGSIMFIILIAFMVYGYKHDIAQCNEVMHDPYGFCVKAGCNPNPLYKGQFGLVMDNTSNNFGLYTINNNSNKS